MESQFFHVRYDGNQYLTSGPSSYFLGHCLEPSGASRDGIFSSWKWDGEQLTIENDRYGISPLYYFVLKNEICVSASLPSLIDRGAPGDLDYQALAVFFRLGYFLGECTPFRAIRALPPNVRFTWNKERVSCVAEYPKVGWSDLSRDKAIEAYIDLFAAAVRRRIPEGPDCVLLSGGRDSRHITFELCRQGRSPSLVGTVDVPTSNDFEVAHVIAEYLSIRHHWLRSSPPSLASERRNLYETNFCTFEHSWILNLRDDLIDRVPCVWDGLAGDVLSAGHFLDENRLHLYRTGSLAELANHLVGSVEKYLKLVLRPAYYDLVSKDIALESILTELRRHVDAPNPVGSFFFWNRTRRVAALSPYALFRRFKGFGPFLDHQLFDLLASLPGEMLVDHKFHDDTIARAYPEWAHLRYARKRRPVFTASPGFCVWLELLIRRPSWLNPMYLLPRLLRAACDHGYGYKAMYLIELPLYLREVQNLAKQKRPVPFEASAPA
jgi:asparagine synthase (glutamine-hydrolysing)